MTLRCSRLVVALALLIALVAATTLAYASPPDPVRMSGFFDDDDSDNGVCLLTSSLITLDPFPLLAWTPGRVFWPSLIREDPSSAAAPDRATADARASPIS